MTSKLRWAGYAGALIVAGVAGVMWLSWLRPLTAQRVDDELGADPDLLFEFFTGPTDALCAASAADDPAIAARTAAALSAGWIARGTGEHPVLRLTAAGQRAVARSPYEATTCESPGSGAAVSTYSVPVARFERAGPPEIEAAETRGRKRVVVHGRWSPNAFGVPLAHAGWAPLLAPAQRTEVFELRLSGWHRIPTLIGHDVPGL